MHSPSSWISTRSREITGTSSMTFDLFPGSLGTMDPYEPSVSFVMDAIDEDTVRDVIRTAAKRIRIGVVNIDITFYEDPDVKRDH